VITAPAPPACDTKFQETSDAGARKKAAEYAAKVVDLTKTADTPLEEVTRAKQLPGR
jgi:hypothetical protein